MLGLISRSAIFLLLIISFAVALIYGGGAWAPFPAGIPDAGQANSWALQLATLAHVVLGLRVLAYLSPGLSWHQLPDKLFRKRAAKQSCMPVQLVPSGQFRQ